MKITRMLLPLAAGVLVATAAVAQMPPMPKPGPEQEVLAMDVGTWDAVVEMNMPGSPAMTSKGTEVATMGCGGMCLITDFSGEMMPGVPFKGHGMTAYDSGKTQYVGSWSDSMSSGLQISASTYDAAAKSMTGSMESTDPSGATVKTKWVVTYINPDQRTMTMLMPGPDGKDVQGMKITYTRHK
jgi:hypothetical protein